MTSFRLSSLVFRKAGVVLTLVAFLLNSSLPAYAQSVLSLPQPGAMVRLSDGFAPAVLKAVKIHTNDPFKFDFIIDTGDSNFTGDELKKESTRLIKYFLAALTTPDNDFWVNLSPYEQNKIIPETFGKTEMGRDLLAQDYILKQLTASIVYPEDDLGKEFWNKVYAQALAKFGTTDIPVDTFNKVWIVPEKAVVYENKVTAYVGETRLKVMLEQDYLALAQGSPEPPDPSNPADSGTLETLNNRDVNTLGSQIVREIIIPVLEKEVNEGKNFATLRQVYHSLVLANWYKKRLKDSILVKIYMDKGKVKGVDIEDKAETQKIYDRYIEAFKKGVYNYIREDIDPVTQEVIPRKYFSGGAMLTRLGAIEEFRPTDQAPAAVITPQNKQAVGVILVDERTRAPLAIPLSDPSRLVDNPSEKNGNDAIALKSEPDAFNAGSSEPRVLPKTMEFAREPSPVVLPEAKALAMADDAQGNPGQFATKLGVLLNIREQLKKYADSLKKDISYYGPSKEREGSDFIPSLRRRLEKIQFAIKNLGVLEGLHAIAAVLPGLETDEKGQYKFLEYVLMYGGQERRSSFELNGTSGSIRMDKDADGNDVLVIIHSVFEGFNHAGRDRNAVYAETETKARHELAELDVIRKFALDNGIDISEGLGKGIFKWANDPNANRLTHQNALRQLDHDAHQAGLKAEADYEGRIYTIQIAEIKPASEVVEDFDWTIAGDDNHYTVGELRRADAGELAGAPALLSITQRRELVDFMMGQEVFSVQELRDFAGRLGLAVSQLYASINELVDQRRFRHADGRWATFVPLYNSDGTAKGQVKEYWARKRDGDMFKSGAVFLLTPEGKLVLQIRDNGQLDISALGAVEVGFDGRTTAVNEAEDKLQLRLDQDSIKAMPLLQDGRYSPLTRDNSLLDLFYVQLDPEQETRWKEKTQEAWMSLGDYQNGKRFRLNDEVSGIVQGTAQEVLGYYLSLSPQERDNKFAHALRAVLDEELFRDFFASVGEKASSSSGVKMTMESLNVALRMKGVVNPDVDKHFLKIFHSIHEINPEVDLRALYRLYDGVARLKMGEPNRKIVVKQYEVHEHNRYGPDSYTRKITEDPFVTLLRFRLGVTGVFRYESMDVDIDWTVKEAWNPFHYITIKYLEYYEAPIEYYELLKFYILAGEENVRKIVLGGKDRFHDVVEQGVRFLGKYSKSEAVGNKEAGFLVFDRLGLRYPAGVVLSEKLVKALPLMSEDEQLKTIEYILDELVRMGINVKEERFAVRSNPNRSMPGILTTKLHIKPEGPDLLAAIEEVRLSWFSEKAYIYRQRNSISDDYDLPIIIEVWKSGRNPKYGEYDKIRTDPASQLFASGVFFTRDPNTNVKELYGVFGLNMQGEDLMTKGKKGTDIKELASIAPTIYQQLLEAKTKLEDEVGPQEVEFVVHDGQLFFLQTRNLNFAPQAAAAYIRELLAEGKISEASAVPYLERLQTKLGKRRLYRVKEERPEKVLAGAFAVSPGAAKGRLVWNPFEAKRMMAEGESVIFVATNRTQDEVLDMILNYPLAGLITTYGNSAYHESDLIRVAGIPSLINLQYDKTRFDGTQMTMDSGRTLIRNDLVVIDGDNNALYDAESVELEDNAVVDQISYGIDLPGTRKKFLSQYLDAGGNIRAEFTRERLRDLYSNLGWDFMEAQQQAEKNGSTELKKKAFILNLKKHFMHELLLQKKEQAGSRGKVSDDHQNGDLKTDLDFDPNERIFVGDYVYTETSSTAFGLHPSTRKTDYDESQHRHKEEDALSFHEYLSDKGINSKLEVIQTNFSPESSGVHFLQVEHTIRFVLLFRDAKDKEKAEQFFKTWQEGNDSGEAQSQLSDQLSPDNKGGIDLNADKLNVDIRSNGQAISFDIDLKVLENLQFDGLIPNIISVAPVRNLALFLSGGSESISATQLSLAR